MRSRSRSSLMTLGGTFGMISKRRPNRTKAKPAKWQGDTECRVCPDYQLASLRWGMKKKMKTELKVGFAVRASASSGRVALLSLRSKEGTLGIKAENGSTRKKTE